MKSGDVKIFPIFNQVTKVWHDFARVYAAAHPSPGAYEAVIDGFRMNWFGSGTKIAFGAYDDNKLIGFINASRLTNVFLRSYGFVNYLYVLPEYQWRYGDGNFAGPGVGARLLGATECAVKLIGCDGMRLNSLPGARDFYIAQGYDVDDEEEGGLYFAEKDLGGFKVSDMTIPVFDATPMMRNACFDIAYSIQKNEGWASDKAKKFAAAVNGNNPAYVAVRDGVVRGFIDGKFLSDASAATIEQLYVHKKFQRKSGIGRSLVSEFCDVAKNSDVTQVALTALRDFEARFFYKKCGFKLLKNSENHMVRGI